MKKIVLFPSVVAVSLISFLSPRIASGAAVRGGATQTATSGLTRGTAVAYDSVNKVYLVVGSHGPLYGRFIFPDGTPTGDQFYIPAVSGVFAAFPRVAFSPDADGGNGAFLVTWNQSADPATPMVHARLVSYVRGGPLGSDNVIGGDSYFESGCAVAYASRSREFLVVWKNNGNLPDIVGVRVNNSAQAIASVAIPHTPDGERDPTVAYDPDDDQFLVVYSGYNNAYAFVGARRVQAGTGAVIDNGDRITLYQTGGTYITEVTYNSRLKKYLASWHSKPANATLAQLVSADGTLSGTTIALSTRWTAYDALGMAYNPISDTFFSVSHNATATSPTEDGGVELNSNGSPIDNGFIVTADGARVGNFYPKIAANTDAPDWLLSAAFDFSAAVVQRVTGSAAGTAPPPPPAPAPLSISSVTVNPSTTIAAGSPVTVSVASSGGVTPVQYQFWRYSYTTQSWTLAQAWSTSTQVSWTPGNFDGGWYKVQAWARSAGGTTWEAWMDSALFRVATSGARVLSFRISASTSSTGAAPTGSPVTVSALASAGVTGAVEYQFWRYNTGTRTWSLDRPWSTNSSYVWTPGASDEGTFVFQVWVRDGSTDWQDWSSAELLVSNLRVTSFTASVPSVADGSPVTFNVSAVGNPAGQYEYKFWRYNVPTGQWIVIRDYTTSSAFTWVPTSRDVGMDNIQVWVRSAGSPASYAAWSMISVSVTPP